MTGGGPLGSVAGVNIEHMSSELVGAPAVLQESFTQDFRYMSRNMVGVTASMDPLVTKDTNFEGVSAGAFGPLSRLDSTFQSFEVEVHETFIKR